MHLSRRVTHSGPAALGSLACDWDVEIHLGVGRVVRARALAADSREAIEEALSRSGLRSTQITGIAASPTRNGAR